MRSLYEQGKIRAIGVSNFSVEQMERFRRVAPLHVLQPPYNLFNAPSRRRSCPYCPPHNTPDARLWCALSWVAERAHAPDTTFDAISAAESTQNSSRPDLRNILMLSGNSMSSRSATSSGA